MNEPKYQLIADVILYPTDQGGRKGPTPSDWYGCPCMINKDDQAWDCRMYLEGKPMMPGETRRLGFVFLSGEDAASLFRKAGKFYLWEAGIKGEATVVLN